MERRLSKFKSLNWKEESLRLKIYQQISKIKKAPVDHKGITSFCLLWLGQVMDLNCRRKVLVKKNKTFLSARQWSLVTDQLGQIQNVPFRGKLRDTPNKNPSGWQRYFFLYWNFGLKSTPSGRPFQPSDSAEAGRDLWLRTGFCGLSNWLLWELWHWQRVLHWTLHRALVLVSLASIPLAFVSNLFLSNALLKHPVWHFHWKQGDPGSNSQ